MSRGAAPSEMLDRLVGLGLRIHGRPRLRQVQQFERSLGFQMPDDLRQFMLQVGAASFDKSVAVHVIERSGWSRSSGTEAFACFVAPVVGVYDVRKTWAMYGARVPARCVPFAESDGGNLFLLDCHQAGGAVRFWDHDVETTEIAETTLCASNLSSFLAALQPDARMVTAEPARAQSKKQTPDPILTAYIEQLHLKRKQ